MKGYLELAASILGQMIRVRANQKQETIVPAQRVDEIKCMKALD